jgi:hypothetical protein
MLNPPFEIVYTPILCGRAYLCFPKKEKFSKRNILKKMSEHADIILGFIEYTYKYIKINDSNNFFRYVTLGIEKFYV